MAGSDGGPSAGQSGGGQPGDLQPGGYHDADPDEQYQELFRPHAPDLGGADILAPRPGQYPPPANPPPAPGGPASSRRPGAVRPRDRGARSPVQRRLIARVAAGKQARRQRAILVTSAVASAIVLVISGAGWALTGYVNGGVGRVNAGTAGTPPSGPLNILVAGVDERAGLTHAQEAALHVGHDVSFNSDTMMLVHLSGDHTKVTVVSLPRDSWVEIPGHGMSKINAAFGLGGAKLMVQTVERATGVTIDNYIEVNFLGFVSVIDALGGVNICLPQAVHDPASGLSLSQGRHHVDGITALKFARDRHSFATGDLARIGNQQQLLSSLLRAAISGGTLANPLRLSRFVRATLSAVRVDQGLNVAALADQMRGVAPKNVAFITVPVANPNYLTPGGQSAVLWDTSAAAQLFAAIASDSPITSTPRKAAVRPAGPVLIDIYNGTLIGGLSGYTGSQLTQLGFHVRAGLTWNRQDVSQTLIEYPPGGQAQARQLGTALPAATLRPQAGLQRIRIVLGVNGHELAAAASAPATDSGTGSGTGSTAGPTHFSTRTADQNACR